MKSFKKNLGDLLVQANFITQNQLNEILKLQPFSGKKLGEILIDEGFVTKQQIIEALEFQLGIPHIDIEKYFIDPKVPLLISENLARRYTLIPIKKEKNKLMVAMADPLNIFAIDDVKISTDLEVDPVIASKDSIFHAIDCYYGKESSQRAIKDFKNQYYVENFTETDKSIFNEINNAPVVRLINSIIHQGFKAQASDIHIEPFEYKVRIRFRIDGELQEIMSVEKATHSAIVTRIKIMGKMNIAERRVPQDGRVETNIDGKEIDLRISTLPTVYGEKIAIRLLNRSNFLLSKNQLGFSQKNLDIFDPIVKSPSGMILVTGPTGSGKTTTMYTILRELNELQKNIITVEDPVEYRLHGINQVQVNTKANLTFSNTLRAILRQDPDIIMIGEIRDTETAHIAVRAAITGHLVLSTMHTNNSSSTISRLVDMGVEPYLISSAISGIISQRLVKKICEHCKEKYMITEYEKNLLNIEKSFIVCKGKGCSHCNYTGYKRRIAVHEIMAINQEIRKSIDKEESIDILRQKALSQGMISLKESCMELVSLGITTVEEMIKVAYSLN